MTKEKIISIFNYISERLSEPSSHAALSVLFMNIGLSSNEAAVQALCVLISGAFSFIAFLMKDAPNKEDK